MCDELSVGSDWKCKPRILVSVNVNDMCSDEAQVTFMIWGPPPLAYELERSRHVSWDIGP